MVRKRPNLRPKWRKKQKIASSESNFAFDVLYLANRMECFVHSHVGRQNTDAGCGDYMIISVRKQRFGVFEPLRWSNN